MDRKNLGFTLIELLVSIAIMGILLMVAIPGVLKIKEDNKAKKYEVYKSAVERAAKLYTDSNSKDMFQYDSNGTYRITLETLKGVGVKDTENGIEIILMGMTSGLLQKYEVIMNIKNYDETDLFNICYEISNEVKNLYYNNNGVPSETQVKEVVRNIMVK